MQHNLMKFSEVFNVLKVILYLKKKIENMSTVFFFDDFHNFYQKYRNYKPG